MVERRNTNMYQEGQSLPPKGGLPLGNNAPWMRDAACVTETANLTWQEIDALFFPEEGVRFSKQAKEMCRNCPVQLQCASFGREEEYGLWGLTTPHTRGRRRKAPKDDALAS